MPTIEPGPRIDPQNLSHEEKLILAMLPSGREGVVTVDEIIKRTGLSQAKVDDILQKFMRLRLVEEKRVKDSPECERD
ncbi:hypothetical protein ACFL2T_00710 [Elusimicrobiota bacterium]